MINNTIFDFLATADPETPGITCPACGSILGIRKQGSTDMILTENARLELDGSINTYRRYIEKLEAFLARINISFRNSKDHYPYIGELNFYKQNSSETSTEALEALSKRDVELKTKGIYKGIIAEKVAQDFVSELDFFEWIKLFTDFPRLDDKDESLVKKCREILLPGLKPRSMIGPLIDLMFDQEKVATWIEMSRDNGLNDKFSKLDDFVNKICPTLLSYLNKLFTLEINGSKGNKSVDVLENIIELKLILAVILGHKHKTPSDLELDMLNVDVDYPFSLPRETVVLPVRLLDLLRSEVVLGNPKIGFSSTTLGMLKAFLKQDNTEIKSAHTANNINYVQDKIDTSKNTQESDLLQVTNALKQEIFKFVNFSCSNPNAVERKDDQSKQSLYQQKFCGWYPKAEPTHSVILLGSPGTSKSTTMLTGLTTFYSNSSSMGAVISFEAPDDEERMNYLINEYKQGKLPKPTNKGDRTTIKLSVEFPESQLFDKTHFVFTDIAGELVARSLRDEGSDPSVLRILKNAETIVFFYDFSIEPAILMELIGSDKEFWSGLSQNYERVLASRREFEPGHDATYELEVSNDIRSRAEVSQIQLLQKLIKDLRSQKGEDNLRKSDINFVCVIPKSDLFVHLDLSADKRYFLNDFYQELRNENILIRPSNYKGDSFRGLRTKGGSGLSSRKSADISRLQYQRQLCRKISNLALESFQHIGDAIGEDAEEIVKAGFSETIRIQLIEVLHHNFGKENVYFLPVSAQGEDNSSYENIYKLGHEPNPKLSEYVFMLPVALSARVGQEEITQEKEAPNSSIERESEERSLISDLLNRRRS